MICCFVSQSSLLTVPHDVPVTSYGRPSGSAPLRVILDGTLQVPLRSASVWGFQPQGGIDGVNVLRQLLNFLLFCTQMRSSLLQLLFKAVSL